MITRSIWSRDGDNEMSQSAYIRAVALSTLLVGGFVAAGSLVSYDWQFSWPLLIITFLAAVAFITLFQMSDNWIASLLGVSGMSCALGLMIGPALALYIATVLMQAVVTTAIIMVVMSMVGILYPKVFEGFGPFLMAGLTLLIVAGFAQIIFFALGFEQAVDMPILTWAGVAIFTLFVAYDWSRALSLPYTLNNAVDASGGLILDAVNLLLRLAELYARAKGRGGYRHR